MSLGYRLLGPLEVLRDRVRLDLGAPKQRSVLACLLLERGRVVSTDRLVEAVWGDDAPPSAVASLQVYVSNLRRLLRGPDGVSPLERRMPGYVLRVRPDQVDADEFARLVDRARELRHRQDWAGALESADRALACWAGEVLGDLEGAAWFEAEASALGERETEARVLRTTALLGTGRASEAVVESQVLTRRHPFRDDLQWLSMLALHQLARTADALDVYAAYAERLGDELGIDPSPELRDLQVALLRQEPWTSRWPADSPAPTDGPAPAAVVDDPPARSASGLVGREPQLALAAEAAADVVRGASRWLVLSGPAGIGKTRLAEEVVALVEQQGGRAVRGHCLEEEGAPAWWPLREIVRDLDADPDVVLQAPSGAEADSARFAVYERVRSLVEEAAATAPVAVLLDDLQWADATTLSCPAYLASVTRAGRVLAVATVRDGEGGPGVRRALAALLRAEGARQIVVPPLSVVDVATLAGRVAGEELAQQEAVRLAEQTGGNALFVCEYARLPREQRQHGDAPLAVRAVLGRRVDSLDPEVVTVLRAAAVIGDVLELDLLARVTRIGTDDLVDLLDEAADAHIIEPRRGAVGYVFSHALLRDEVLAGISPLRRQRLHASVAEALVTEGGERLTRRAQHLLAAGPLVGARELLDVCRAAALQAEERWSSETAVRWWETAREALERLPAEEQDPQERDDLVVARVEALARSGRGQTVLDVVDEQLLAALREGRTTTAGRLAAALLRSTGTWPWVAIGQDAAPLLTHLGGALPAVAGDLTARVRVMAALAVGHCYAPDPAVPDRLSAEALELAEEIGDPEVLADALLGRVLTYVGVAGHAEEAERLLDRLLRLPRARADVDAVIAHGAMTMSRVLHADVRGSEDRRPPGRSTTRRWRRTPASSCTTAWAAASGRWCGWRCAGRRAGSPRSRPTRASRSWSGPRRRRRPAASPRLRPT